MAVTDERAVVPTEDTGSIGTVDLVGRLSALRLQYARLGDAVPVAVRSSAIGADSARAIDRATLGAGGPRPRPRRAVRRLTVMTAPACPG
ncbi:MAG: hypothetical protein JWR70_865 [Modestobacter sp.]|nr:hypothetical protein [Modestobacter sp.]